jgi:hypothetical protein
VQQGISQVESLKFAQVLLGPAPSILQMVVQELKTKFGTWEIPWE